MLEIIFIWVVLFWVLLLGAFGVISARTMTSLAQIAFAPVLAILLIRALAALGRPLMKRFGDRFRQWVVRKDSTSDPSPSHLA